MRNDENQANTNKWEFTLDDELWTLNLLEEGGLDAECYSPAIHQVYRLTIDELQLWCVMTDMPKSMPAAFIEAHVRFNRTTELVAGIRERGTLAFSTSRLNP